MKSLNNLSMGCAEAKKILKNVRKGEKVDSDLLLLAALHYETCRKCNKPSDSMQQP